MEISLICNLNNNIMTKISNVKYKLLIEKNTEYLDKLIYAIIDRPLGCRSKKEYPEFVYELNYGYIPNTISGDGEELDCYILGVNQPVKEFNGKCIAIIHRIDEDDDKLILVPENLSLSSSEICNMVFFSEKYHKSFLYMK